MNRHQQSKKKAPRAARRFLDVEAEADDREAREERVAPRTAADDEMFDDGPLPEDPPGLHAQVGSFMGIAFDREVDKHSLRDDRDALDEAQHRARYSQIEEVAPESFGERFRNMTEDQIAQERFRIHDRAERSRERAYANLNPDSLPRKERDGFRLTKTPFHGFSDEFPMHDSVHFDIRPPYIETGKPQFDAFDGGIKAKASQKLLYMIMRANEMIAMPAPQKGSQKRKPDAPPVAPGADVAVENVEEEKEEAPPKIKRARGAAFAIVQREYARQQKEREEEAEEEAEEAEEDLMEEAEEDPNAREGAADEMVEEVPEFAEPSRAPNCFSFEVEESPGTWVHKTSLVFERFVVTSQNNRWDLGGMRVHWFSHTPEVDLNELLDRVVKESYELEQKEVNRANNTGKRMNIVHSQGPGCIRDVRTPADFYAKVIAPLCGVSQEDLVDATAQNYMLADDDNPLRPTLRLKIERACAARELEQDSVEARQQTADSYYSDATRFSGLVRTFPLPAFAVRFSPADLTGDALQRMIFPDSGVMRRACRLKSPDGKDPIAAPAMAEDEMAEEFFNGDVGGQANFMGAEQGEEKLNTVEDEIRRRSLVDILAVRNQQDIFEIEEARDEDPAAFERKMSEFRVKATKAALEEMNKPSSKKLLSMPTCVALDFLKGNLLDWRPFPHMFADKNLRSDDQFAIVLLEMVTGLFDLRPGKMQRDALIELIGAWTASHHVLGLKPNVLDHGSHSAGKSKKLECLEVLLVKGTFRKIVGLSDKAFEVDEHLDDFVWMWHEAPPQRFSVDPKTGMPMPGGSETLKAKLTDGVVITWECGYVKDPTADPNDKEARVRRQRRSVSRQIGWMGVAFNWEIPMPSTGSDDEQLAILSRFLHLAASTSFHSEISTLTSALETLKRQKTPQQARFIIMMRMIQSMIIITEKLIGAKALPEIDVSMAVDFCRFADQKLREEGRSGIGPRTGLMFVEMCRAMNAASNVWTWFMSELARPVRVRPDGHHEPALTADMFLLLSKHHCVRSSQVVQIATLMEDILVPITRDFVVAEISKMLKERKRETGAIAYRTVFEKEERNDMNYIVVSENGLAGLAKQIEQRAGSTVPHAKIHRELSRMRFSMAKRYGAFESADPIAMIVCESTTKSGRTNSRRVCIATSVVMKAMDLPDGVMAAVGTGACSVDSVETADPLVRLQNFASNVESNLVPFKKVEGRARQLFELQNNIGPLRDAADAHADLFANEPRFQPFRVQIDKLMEKLDRVKSADKIPDSWYNNLIVLYKNLKNCIEKRIEDMVNATPQPGRMQKKTTKRAGKEKKHTAEPEEVRGWGDKIFEVVPNDKPMVGPLEMTERFRDALASGQAARERPYERESIMVRILREFFCHRNTVEQTMIDFGALPTRCMRWQKLAAVLRTEPVPTRVLAPKNLMRPSMLTHMLYANAFGVKPQESEMMPFDYIDLDTSDTYTLRHWRVNGFPMNANMLPSAVRDVVEEVREGFDHRYAGQLRYQSYPVSVLELEMEKIRIDQAMENTRRRIEAGKFNEDDEDVQAMVSIGVGFRSITHGMKDVPQGLMMFREQARALMPKSSILVEHQREDAIPQQGQNVREMFNSTKFVGSKGVLNKMDKGAVNMTYSSKK